MPRSRRGPEAPSRLRAISNTLAGLIILTFILATVVPLTLNIILSSNAASIKLAGIISQEIRASRPSFNVTLDPALTTNTTNAYRVENIGSMDRRLYLLLVADKNGNVYLVKARDCVSPASCSAGAATVTVTLGDFAVPDRNWITIKPRGFVEVLVTSGKLLGVIDDYGSYARAASTQVSTVTVAEYARYAAVAGGVQTNYFQLSNYSDLADLSNSSDVALVTDPSQNTTNTSILWSNAIESYCAVDYGGYTRAAVGGFQPVNDAGGNLTKARLKGLLMFNLQPYASTFVVGGRGGSYDKPFYGSAMLLHAYGFAPFDPDYPIGLFAAVDYDGSWMVVFNIDGAAYKVDSSVVGVTPSGVINELANRVWSHMYSEQAYIGSTDNHVEGTWGGTPDYRLWLDTNGYGLLLIGPIEMTSGGGGGGWWWSSSSTTQVNITIYCPAPLINATVNVDGKLHIEANNCIAAAVDDSNNFYAGFVNITLDTDSYMSDGKGGYIGYDDYVDYMYIVGDLGDVGTSSYTSLYKVPFKLKLVGNTTRLEVISYYYYRDRSDCTKVTEKLLVRDNSTAFGYYPFSGFSDYGICGWRTVYYDQVAHAIYLYGLRDVELTWFKFQEGATSGLEPYTLFADTDGNGLVEMIFFDEDAAPGWENSLDDVIRYNVVNSSLGSSDNRLVYLRFIDDTWSQPMGCNDKTLSTVYLKFLNRYAVNGKYVAEVSVQIRYLFHDNAGSDVDEVDDPMHYLMSFQLVDANGTVYSSSDYIYQQLMGLEDTLPPNSNWVSDSVFLLVPNEDQYYYVVFAVNDPYGWDATHDDFDFLLAVEWLGMWYLYR